MMQVRVLIILALSTGMLTGLATTNGLAQSIQFGPMRIQLPPMFQQQQQRHTPTHHRERSNENADHASEEPKAPQIHDQNHDAALRELGKCDGCEVVLAQATTKSVMSIPGNSGVNLIGITRSTGFTRDLQDRIKDFVDRIGKKMEEQKSTIGGDVNLYNVEQSVNSAYDDAKLAQFETFKDESWTQDRLKVAIINLAAHDLDGVLVGNTLGRVMMTDVERMIRNAAHQVYLRTFETAEALAMNKRLDDFARTVLEEGGSDDYIPADLNDIVASAEILLRQADPKRQLVRTKELGMALKFRALRAGIDCFTQVYRTKIATDPITPEANADHTAPNPAVAPAGAPTTDQRGLQANHSTESADEGDDPDARPNAPGAAMETDADNATPEQAPVAEKKPTSGPDVDVVALVHALASDTSDTNVCRKAIQALMASPDALKRPVPRVAIWHTDHWEGDGSLSSAAN